MMLQVLAYRLKQFGYTVHTPGYRSLTQTPDENAQQLAHYIRKHDFSQLHIVAHSLGGIVSLHLLSNYQPLPDGRLVTLGSPVTGSTVAQQLTTKSKLMVRLFGKSMERGLSGQHIPDSPKREWGVIAGNSPVGLGRFLVNFNEDNDGAVALTETLHPALNDRIVLHESHTGMLFSKEVAEQTLHFLESGQFKR